jgi:uncharacterized protein with HEPN domain
VSRDPRLYVADIVAAGDAVLRYIADVSFDAFAADDEKRAAVERQVFVIGEAAVRCRTNGSSGVPRCVGGRSSAWGICWPTGRG